MAVFMSHTDSEPPTAGTNDMKEHWCDLAPDAMLCLNERWELLFVNRAAVDLFSTETPLEAGKPAWQWPILLSVLGQLHLDRLKSAGSDEGSFRTLRSVEISKPAAPLPLEVSISISGETGNRIFALVFRDVTHQRPTDAKLYQSQKQQVVGSLAGGIAHDFNNILTAVICRIELALGNRDLPENVRENLTHAVESARRGAELNRKLMSFSKRVSSTPSRLDVPRLIEETVFILRRSVDPRIQIIVPPATDLWHALGDEDQFMQLLMNLCLNARDAMPQGGELTIECANCAFDSQNAQPPRHPGEFVRITVSDTGHGMTPEVLARLFEPYFSTKGFGKGAGLGLSIANHIVVEHGGWMEVESQHGEGTRFHVYLPRTTSSLPAPKLKEHRVDGGSVLKGTETLLIVDDENSIRSVMTATLSFRGFRVLEAQNGEEAVQRYRESGKDIDLVLLDIQMPRMNGWDTMDAILSLNPKARIILLSGGTPNPPHAGAADRALGLLLKPFESVKLLRAIREALDGQKIS